MKKVIWLFLLGVMVLGTKNVLADSVIASQQSDARLVDNIDLIFMGYANKVVEHKNIADFRLNNAAGAFGGGNSEWGGAIDGKHDDLGVIGVYINRPLTPFIFNNEPGTWTPVGGTSNWNGTRSANLTGTGNISGRGFGWENPTNKVDIFWGKDSTDSNIGVHVNYGDSQNVGGAENASVTNSTTPFPGNSQVTNYSRIFAADLGLGLKNAGFFSEVDLHAGFGLGVASDTRSNAFTGAGDHINDTMNDTGIYTISAGVLAQHDMDKDDDLRMFGDIKINQFGGKESLTDDGNNDGILHNNAADADYENNTSTNSFVVNLGLGCNHKVNDGAAVFSTGLLGSFTSGAQKATEWSQNGNTANLTYDLNGFEVDTTNLSIIWTGGVDTKVASWLNARAGISKAIISSQNNKTITPAIAPATNNNTTTAFGDANPNLGFSCGFGIHWENWALNTNVTAASLETAITGVQPGRGIFVAGNIVTVAEADLGYAF